MHNPEEYYVTLAAVTISKPNKEKDNAVMLCKIVHKNMYLVIEPSYDRHGIEMRSSKVEDETWQLLATSLCSLRCARPGCGTTDNLKVCAGCNDARYCCRDCQLTDRRAHGRRCKELAGKKRAAKAFLREQMQSKSSVL
jgi:MYND finger